MTDQNSQAIDYDEIVDFLGKNPKFGGYSLMVSMNTPIQRQKLTAQWITSEGFKPFGQLILPSEDGKTFDETDAQLDLQQGIPRFYIMRLQQRGRSFHTITRHQKCTQCLGSLAGKAWLMAVAPPSASSTPNMAAMQAFRIPGNCFIKLAVGTWHAGPYFDDEWIDFYNLELSDTNLVDHFTHNFLKSDRLQFELQ